MSIRIGVLWPRARSALHTSSPSRPGIIRSSTSRSLARSAWLASAAGPSATALHLVAGAAQVHHQQVADVGLVFGHQDVLRHAALSRRAVPALRKCDARRDLRRAARELRLATVTALLRHPGVRPMPAAATTAATAPLPWPAVWPRTAGAPRLPGALRAAQAARPGAGRGRGARRVRGGAERARALRRRIGAAHLADGRAQAQGGRPGAPTHGAAQPGRARRGRRHAGARVPAAAAGPGGRAAPAAAPDAAPHRRAAARACAMRCACACCTTSPPSRCARRWSISEENLFVRLHRARKQLLS